MPTIKKIGNIVFTILNTLIILSLLLFSTVLILSVNSNSPAILGFSSKLIFDRADESAMLVISQTSSKLEEMEEFVYLTPDGIGIYIADTVDDTTVTYRGLDNTITSSILLTSPEYGGKVLVKNAPIGEMLSTLVKTESMSVVYVLIIGTFSLLLLLIFLVHYLLKNKDRLVEYYEEVEEELVDENGVVLNGMPMQQPQAEHLDPQQPMAQPVAAEAFDEIPEVYVQETKKEKAKAKKKKKKSKSAQDAEVLELIDGIEKNPKQAPTITVDGRTSLQTPATRAGKRPSVPRASAMPRSNYGDNLATYELEINEDTTSIDNDAFLSQTTLDSTYSDDDILAVLTEPNATFVVEDEDDDYYEDGNVKYFSNGTDKPSLQESLIAYVHTNPDVDPEPPLPLAKTTDGIPIVWFESILELANQDPRLPEVLLEDFEIKPVEVEAPVASARDIIERVEEMSTFKRQHQSGGFTVVPTPGGKPSADSLLQELDSLFQKPEEPQQFQQLQPDENAPPTIVPPSLIDEYNLEDSIEEMQEQYG